MRERGVYIVSIIKLLKSPPLSSFLHLLAREMDDDTAGDVNEYLTLWFFFRCCLHSAAYFSEFENCYEFIFSES